jgi:hypothetical protein
VTRHPIDPVSAALGIVTALLALAVTTSQLPDLVGGGPWWIAAAALALGVGLIPWSGISRRQPEGSSGSGEPIAAASSTAADGLPSG